MKEKGFWIFLIKYIDMYVIIYLKWYIKSKMVEKVFSRVFFFFVCNCVYYIFF